MTDIPGGEPGEWGKREYEIQLLTPNMHREGARWRPMGTSLFPNFDKAEWAITDMVNSMLASGLDPAGVLNWRETRVRVMVKVTTAKYEEEMPSGH